MTENLFHIIGYTGEVSEPNGPRVLGYFLDDWGKTANVMFNAWLEKHDLEVKKAALLEYADATHVHKYQTDPWLSWEDVRNDVQEWARNYE